jgi:hypothetical protein
MASAYSVERAAAALCDGRKICNAIYNVILWTILTEDNNENSIP